MVSGHSCAAVAVIVAVAVVVACSQLPACEDPYIGIQSPDPGNGPVSQTVSIDTWVDEYAEFEKVEYFVDGQLIGQDTAAPFSLGWDTTTLDDGEHTIQAKGTLNGGLVKESEPVVVEVDNN